MYTYLPQPLEDFQFGAHGVHVGLDRVAVHDGHAIVSRVHGRRRVVRIVDGDEGRLVLAEDEAVQLSLRGLRVLLKVLLEAVGPLIPHYQFLNRVRPCGYSP